MATAASLGCCAPSPLFSRAKRQWPRIIIYYAATCFPPQLRSLPALPTSNSGLVSSSVAATGRGHCRAASPQRQRSLPPLSLSKAAASTRPPPSRGWTRPLLRTSETALPPPSLAEQSGSGLASSSITRPLLLPSAAALHPHSANKGNSGLVSSSVAGTERGHCRSASPRRQRSLPPWLSSEAAAATRLPPLRGRTRRLLRTSAAAIPPRSIAERSGSGLPSSFLAGTGRGHRLFPRRPSSLSPLLPRKEAAAARPPPSLGRSAAAALDG